jgi:hypothetical protein
MGRQEHGWFGDGEGPEKSEAASGSGGMFGPGGLSKRIQALPIVPSELRPRRSGHARRLSMARAIWRG